MTDLLRFVVPETARLKESACAKELLFPRCGEGNTHFKLESFVDSQSMYRNVIAWYLRAAGLATKSIADYLSISPSRVNSLALRTRKQLYSGVTIELLKFTGKKASLTGQQFQAHVFAGRKSEMRAAEDALSHCIKGSHSVVSGALRLGRAAYLEAMESFEGTKCGCDACSSYMTAYTSDLSPYWVEEDEPELATNQA